MTAVAFTPHNGRYSVRFDYSRAVVELIKRTVPAYARSWSPHTKEWFVDADWACPLAAELRGVGCLVVGLHDSNVCTNSNWAAELFRRVGPHRTPAVHRALTKVLHPDNTETGCPALQRELNSARAELGGAR